jgi:CBS domain-containing protein
MSSPVVTVPDWITVEQFITGVAPNHPFTTYPVHDPAGKLTGVVRLPDLVRVPRDDQATARLIEFANPIGSVPVTWPEEELATMIQRLGGTIDQRVLVFNQGELAGIISPADIARLLTVRQSQAGSGKP